MDSFARGMVKGLHTPEPGPYKYGGMYSEAPPNGDTAYSYDRDLDGLPPAIAEFFRVTYPPKAWKAYAADYFSMGVEHKEKFLDFIRGETYETGREAYRQKATAYYQKADERTSIAEAAKVAPPLGSLPNINLGLPAAEQMRSIGAGGDIREPLIAPGAQPFVEATAFGARSDWDSLADPGVPIEEKIGIIGRMPTKQQADAATKVVSELTGMSKAQLAAATARYQAETVSSTAKAVAEIGAQADVRGREITGASAVEAAKAGAGSLLERLMLTNQLKGENIGVQDAQEFAKTVLDKAKGVTGNVKWEEVGSIAEALAPPYYSALKREGIVVPQDLAGIAGALYVLKGLKPSEIGLNAETISNAMQLKRGQMEGIARKYEQRGLKPVADYLRQRYNMLHGAK